jgi:hypothetical protein
MPLKANIGVTRKVSDNQYGSRGASVNLEVELDSGLINDPERCHERIRQVFRLAQQAIDDELNRQQGNGTASHTTNAATNGHATEPSHNGNGSGYATNGNSQHTNGNGNGHATNGNSNGANGNGTNGTNGSSGNGSNGNGQRNGNGRAASEKQLSFAKQLSKSIQGLGIRRLETLVQKMFGKPLAALTSMDASGLIDTLKNIKDGQIDLDSVLEGNAA